MIDWDRVSELRMEVGEDEFAAILHLFLDELEGVLRRLRRCERSRLAEDLHFLRDGARTLGFTLFATRCFEALGRIGLREDGLGVEALEHCYAASKQGLMQALQAGATDNLRRS